MNDAIAIIKTDTVIIKTARINAGFELLILFDFNMFDFIKFIQKPVDTAPRTMNIGIKRTLCGSTDTTAVAPPDIPRSFTRNETVKPIDIPFTNNAIKIKGDNITVIPENQMKKAVMKLFLNEF